MKDYFLWLAKLVTLLILLIVVIPVMIGTMLVATKSLAGDPIPGIKGKNEVAVVELKGLIMNERDIVDELYRQVENPKVKAIVLRVDSPGGAVGPSQDIFRTVQKLKARKPIVASMGALAASGGLYSSLGASKIFCEPGTLTGSIGVILQVPNIHRLAEFIGVNVITIKSGKLKDVGNQFREMTDEEKTFLEGTASAVHEEFMAAVSEARSIPLEKVREFADGRIIIGTQAKELKLVDEFGDVYDAARASLELAGEHLKDDEVPTLTYPMDKWREFKAIFNTISSIPAIFSREPQLQYVMY